MIWRIYYTAQARQDLKDIYDYIYHEIMSPASATNQVSKILTAIRKLEEMPLRHRLYEYEPWYSRGLRFFPVGNYLIFYMPDEANDTVNIIRIMYSGRDTKKQLEDN